MPPPPTHITVNFRDAKGLEQAFKLKPTTNIVKAMVCLPTPSNTCLTVPFARSFCLQDAFSAKVERPTSQLRFLIDGVRINGGTCSDVSFPPHNDISRPGVLTDQNYRTRLRMATLSKSWRSKSAAAMAAVVAPAIAAIRIAMVNAAAGREDVASKGQHDGNPKCGGYTRLLSRQACVLIYSGPHAW